MKRTFHHFTVDVEEYFHPSALEPFVPRESWPGFPRRSPSVIERLLGVLEEHQTLGTFFTLGWLAEKEPAMVKAIASAGHEVGSHSYDHARVTTQSIAQFRESVRRSKGVLEDITGEKVKGFRAPSFSIVPGFEWALDVLIEEGYEYDSSLFPITHHPTYGYPQTPRDAWRIERPAGTISEVPPATLRAFRTNIPASGGAYLRFFPFSLIRGALRQAERRERSGTFYIHPWELDTHVPDLPMTRLARTRTFSSFGSTWKRVRALLEEFRFERIDRALLALDSAPLALP